MRYNVHAQRFVGSRPTIYKVEGYVVDKRTYDAAVAQNLSSAPHQICLTTAEVQAVENLLSKICLNDTEASVLRQLRGIVR